MKDFPAIALIAEDHRHPKLDQPWFLPCSERSLVALELYDVAKVAGAIPHHLVEPGGHRLGMENPSFPEDRDGLAARRLDCVPSAAGRSERVGQGRVIAFGPQTQDRARIAFDVGTQRVP